MFAYANTRRIAPGVFPARANANHSAAATLPIPSPTRQDERTAHSVRVPRLSSFPLRRIRCPILQVRTPQATEPVTSAALGCAAANLLCARPRRWQKRGFAEVLRPLPGKTIRQRLVCSNEVVEMPLPPVCLRQPPAQSLKSQRRSGVSGPSGATPALTACAGRKMLQSRI